MKAWIKGVIIGGVLGGLLYIVLTIILSFMIPGFRESVDTNISSSKMQFFLRVIIGAIAGSLFYSFLVRRNLIKI
jgi:hypothetical protein